MQMYTWKLKETVGCKQRSKEVSCQGQQMSLGKWGAPGALRVWCTALGHVSQPAPAQRGEPMFPVEGKGSSFLGAPPSFLSHDIPTCLREHNGQKADPSTRHRKPVHRARSVSWWKGRAENRRVSGLWRGLQEEIFHFSLRRRAYSEHGYCMRNVAREGLKPGRPLT